MTNLNILGFVSIFVGILPIATLPALPHADWVPLYFVSSILASMIGMGLTMFFAARDMKQEG